MIGIGHFDAIGRDRRVADELAAEQVHEQRRPARRIPQAGVGAIRQQAQHGVGAVQGIPAATARQPGLERFLRRQRRGDVAGIGDQDIGRLDRGDVLVILEHAGAHGGIIGQELEQFEPGKVDIVPHPAADQHAIDPAGVGVWRRLAHASAPSLPSAMPR
jgi:hypothetical protein